MIRDVELMWFTPRTKDDEVNFVIANEYADFLEFLEDELGIEWAKELKEKFDNQQTKL